MIFSAKDEAGVSIFDKVVSGQKTVTTRYGVSAAKLLKKWEWYVLREKHLSDTGEWDGLRELRKQVPMICVQSGRGKKSVGYRVIKNVERRCDWWRDTIVELRKFSKPGQWLADCEKAEALEAWREGFDSWEFFKKAATEFAKSKGKQFDDGVRIEFNSTNI